MNKLENNKKYLNKKNLKKDFIWKKLTGSLKVAACGLIRPDSVPHNNVYTLFIPP